ncbi:MAG: MarR family transcriptional regulator [Desulfobacterales bacterium]|nr:hypothetical protein [Deltaproteobacteria bacterium]NNL42097.1 MarR family transcriptional regulator [Desulfobacterales bacterium]
MNVLSGNISSMIFKQVVTGGMGDITLDSGLLNVFMELDGRKNLGMVAQKTGLNMGEIRNAISKLLKMKLVESSTENILMVEGEFFNFLNAQLSLAVGPIAGVLIEDEIVNMGHGIASFPASKAAELVEIISMTIEHEEKRSVFKVSMVKKLKEKGY